jgi:hypothetical protein
VNQSAELAARFDIGLFLPEPKALIDLFILKRRTTPT